MEHVVFYSEDSGQSEFRRVGDLEAAVRLVETLRNERGIADVTVHALTPVPVSFKTYYRVEIATTESDASDDVPALAVPLLADEPRHAPVLLAVPALLDDPTDDSGADLETDDSASSAAFGGLTSLNYELAESYDPVESLDSAENHEAAQGHDSVEGADSAEHPESSEGLISGEDFELLVPQSRPEAEAERSLGYFAR